MLGGLRADRGDGLIEVPGLGSLNRLAPQIGVGRGGRAYPTMVGPIMLRYFGSSNVLRCFGVGRYRASSGSIFPARWRRMRTSFCRTMISSDLDRTMGRRVQAQRTVKILFGTFTCTPRFGLSTSCVTATLPAMLTS